MTLILKTAKDTWLLQRKADPTELSDSEKAPISANSEYSIEACQIDEAFLQITLSAPLDDQTEWFIHADCTIAFTLADSPVPLRLPRPGSIGGIQSAQGPNDPEPKISPTPNPKPSPRPRRF
ncbi:hypothetical protein ACQ4M3_29485 [Leptolyngbya sp. AN03gr2]|uniref:hypothetical protein n=1 Tax=unclassified Leptolyngbya TaxID=2650499 RepID=UPI003D31DBC6